MPKQRLWALVLSDYFDGLFAQRAAARVSENLKNGTFQYKAAQAGDDPSVTIWRFSMYGGIRFGDPDVPGQVATRIGVMTGPRSIREKAGRAVRFGVTSARGSRELLKFPKSPEASRSAVPSGVRLCQVQSARRSSPGGRIVMSQSLHQTALDVSSLRLTEHGRLTDNGCGRPD